MHADDYPLVAVQKFGTRLRGFFHAVRHILIENSRLNRITGILRARRSLGNCEKPLDVYVWGRLVVSGSGLIKLGHKVFFLAGARDSRMRSETGATLSIGDGTGFSAGVEIHCHHAISIGRNCRIASRVRISDKIGDRLAPIEIGSDVWIAHGATIDPGVTIGDRSVVSAGSVVRQNVGAEMMVIGNPGRALPLRFSKA